MSRKAGSRDDTNLSLRARSRTQLRQTSGSHTSFSEALFALGKTYAPSRWGSTGPFPINRLPLF